MEVDRPVHPFDELMKRLHKDLLSRLVAAAANATIIVLTVLPAWGLVWLAAVILNELTEAWLGRARRTGRMTLQTADSLFCANLVFGGLVWASGALSVATVGGIGEVLVCLAVLVGGLTHVIATSISHLRAFLCAAIPLVLGIAALPVVLAIYGDASMHDAQLAALGLTFLLIYAASAAWQSYQRERTLVHYLGQVSVASTAKSRFLATMSHEIRTPLNGIIGLTDVLRKSVTDPVQREIIDLVQTSGHTLERLVSDVLDSSKIEAGKLDLAPGVFDLRKTIETAAYLMRSRAEEKGLAFDIRFTSKADGAFIGDAVRIRQIVSNLTSNAVKFTNAGAITVEVDASPTGDGFEEVHIWVRDTGIGFSADTGARLFARFEQADSSISRKFGGTGLGLSISRSLAELMGGGITATSQEGRGSTFHVWLRLERPPADLAHASVPADTPKSDQAPSLRSVMRVLVAEDNVVNQRVIRLMLESFGAEVTIVSNGAEAVSALRTAAFDIVLMDMMMPEMDGLTATRAVRALEQSAHLQRTPIAMLSANAMAEHVQAAIEAGCDSHIAKPVTGAGLVAGIEDAIERVQARLRTAA
jgi:signal transduction histidine kinase/ActR/RegA family two-component response regulator